MDERSRDLAAARRLHSGIAPESSAGKENDRMSITDLKFRLDFFNAPRTLNTFLASLLSIGAARRAVVKLAGKVKPTDGKQEYDAEVNLAVISLGGEDGSGDNWIFSGYLDDGKFVNGYIRLPDGAGYLLCGK